MPRHLSLLAWLLASLLLLAPRLAAAVSSTANLGGSLVGSSEPSTLEGTDWTEITYDFAGRPATVQRCLGGSACSGTQQWTLLLHDDQGRLLARFGSSGAGETATISLQEPRARYAELGWFLSPDPVEWGGRGDPQSYHRSQYARGNRRNFAG